MKISVIPSICTIVLIGLLIIDDITLIEFLIAFGVWYVAGTLENTK